MPTLEAGSRPPGPCATQHRLAARGAGFTLLELLVVLSIIAIATAGVSLALRDSGATSLQRESERLAVLLESGRAQSRRTGVPVRWTVRSDGFLFAGLPDGALPGQWLDSATRAQVAGPVQLGPEPVIAASQIVLLSANAPGLRWRIWTDGLHPFAAQAFDGAATGGVP